MAVWDDLAAALLELRDAPGRPLTGYPDPRVNRTGETRFHISLRGWATLEAETLQQRFADSVDLTVGFLRYPQCRLERPIPDDHVTRSEIHPSELKISLESPLQVSSGQYLHHPLLLHNVSDQDMTVRTNGNLTAMVFAPESGMLVGGFSGAQHFRGVDVAIGAGGSATIPLLVGTDSLSPSLGYAIPPGAWMARAPLDLADGRRLWTGPIAITVTM